MPEVPKIVYARLQGAAKGSHPDANLLSAFAEQMLSASERESVLEHLAQCEECRETIALSVPALEAAPEIAVESARPASRILPARRRTWFAWNRLGWAGLAAGVLIAVGVLMTQSGKKNFEEARQTGAATVAQPAGKAESDKAAAPPSSEVRTTAQNRLAELAVPAETRRDEMKTKKLATTIAAPRGAVSPVLADKLDQPKPPTSPVAGGAVGAVVGQNSEKDLRGGQAGGALAPPPRAATETVEVNGSVPVINTEAAQTNESVAVTAEAVPVVRAKVARAQEESASSADVKQQYSGSALQNLPLSSRDVAELQKAVPGARQGFPQWTLREDKVQRLSESGGRWRTVFHHRGLRCISAFGTHVWAAGKNGAVFHSADSGATWTEVRPLIGDQTLQDDVTRIDVSGPDQVVLSTGKNESWSTLDGGTTWARK